MQITLAVPTNRGINPNTLESLLKLVAHGGYNFHILIAENGYTIAENRNYIAVQALNAGSNYVLMIDDDMTFDPDLLDVLIANGKDIVGAAYHPRSETGQIIKYINAGTDEITPIKIEEMDDPKYKDTFEVHANGTGVMLIKCEVFKNMPRPWFAFEYHETGQCKLGEDWYFCREAKKAGYKIYTDPKPIIGHIGEAIF